MSSDQPRHVAGTPTGGQFAATTRREAGLTLVPGEGLPVQDVLRGELDRLTVRREQLEVTALVLFEQHAAAVERRRGARTAREARDVGGDIAELDFMRETLAAETELARYDIQVLQTHIDIATEPGAVIAEVEHLMGARDYYDQAKAAPKLTALDLECDAGRMATHPWREPGRDERVTDLQRSLEVTPRHPAAQAWAEQLAVLQDPRRMDRIAVDARNGAVDAEQRREAAARATQANMTAMTTGGATPRLRVV